MEPPISLVQLHPSDNVAVALDNLHVGQTYPLGNNADLLVREAIRPGHKVAIRPLEPGSRVLKYGQPIGVTLSSVATGSWVHCHNLTNESAESEAMHARQPPPPPAPLERTFQGYVRRGGRVGTRNYIGILSNVNCSASVSRFVAERFGPEQLRRYPHVDGVVAFTHPSGCAMPFGNLGHHMLNRVLGGMARHPNIAAYLLIGLGCEQVTTGYLIDHQRLVHIEGTSVERPYVLSIQDQGGTARTVEAGVAAIEQLLPQVNAYRRETVSAKHLVLGTECGGSDGYSGITANPAVGVASDLVVACGGTAILSETPEIYGAEHLLTRRAVTSEVAQKLLDRIQWWKSYAGMFGAELNNNPSVGNKEGGLSTIAEKSLGAIAKGGSTALVDVYEYAEPVTSSGLVVMDTPGFDPASVTGMVAGGANIVAFTTGRGSCFGCKPAPSLKIATNSAMYERLSDDMDLDAGTILCGEPVSSVGARLFEDLLAVASGKRTRSEELGIGGEEFVPWIVGPVL